MGLNVLVDYDNVPAALWAPGPVKTAAAICARLPASVVGSEPQLTVRLYGGWKTGSISTHRAQQLIPQLALGHSYMARPGHAPGAPQIRLVVQLALAPLGAQTQFETTLAKDRAIRSFRPRQGITACAQPTACGMAYLAKLTHTTPCTAPNCSMTPQDLFVRDEQKMVDTLMVADMAHAAYVDGDQDIVVVTSDTDIWPGVLLAIKGGCAVTQIHATPNMRVPKSLTNMLPPGVSTYFNEISL